MNGATRGTIASHAVAAVGMSLPWPLLVLLVWERAGDGWVLGVAGAARMLPYVALSWATGTLAELRQRVEQNASLEQVFLSVTEEGAAQASGP